MTILAITMLIGTGFACGGAVAGLLLAIFLRPILSSSKTGAEYLKTFKGIITYIVFGGGIVGTGIFTLLGQTNPGEVWACFLIGLLLGFLAGLLYVRGTDADVRHRFGESPSSDQETLCDALDNEHDRDDEEFAQRYEDAVDAIVEKLPDDDEVQ